MSSTDPTAIVDQFVDAYNSGDDDKLLSLCADNVFITHHNRDVTVESKAAFGELLKGFAGAFPDKNFGNRRARYVDGSNVIVEHTWTGTAEADVPGFANKGEAARLDLCTRYTIRDGLIVEYHDYG